MNLTPYEANVIARWNEATPRIPGNSVPGLADWIGRASVESLRDLYEALYKKKTARRNHAGLVFAVAKLNEAISAADLRCQAAHA